MVVRVLYTVQGIRNIIHYDATQKILEMYGSYYGMYWNTVEYRPELDGREWKLVESTSYRTVLGLIGPYSYPCRHTQPCDLWCQRRAMSMTQSGLELTAKSYMYCLPALLSFKFIDTK